HAAFRLAAAIRQKTTLDRLPDRMPIRPEHHLIPPGEIRERFRFLPDAPLNAEKLAAECCYDVIPRRRIEPPIRVPLGHDATSFLRQTCEELFKRHQWPNEPAARRRLEYEMQTLSNLDFAGHGVFMAELAAEARRQNWPLTLRG